MSVYTHEPGHKYHTESYIISELQDCLSPATLRWGERSLGEFACIRPILPWMPVNPIRQLTISYSFKGSGKAFRAREELKRLLPRRLHPWVTKARSANRSPKHQLRSYGQTEEERRRWEAYKQARHAAGLSSWDWRDIGEYNAEYARLTKGQLWMKYCVPEEVKTEILRHMANLDTFWLCATGRVNPHVVKQHITHQLTLALEE